MNICKHVCIISVVFFASLTFVHTTYAVINPLSVPNNKMGIHILFPQELADAAKLINTSGGDWGYATIPIQAGDKDLQKWQHFMDDARTYHVIPIIRLATEGDYFNTKVWRKPQYNDVIDFANFLNSLNWPTKNRYVIIFNETNRGDEWGGETNPSEYADILSLAVTVFKSRSQDFFIISAGFDNAAANNGRTAMNEYDFMWQMNQHIPGIYDQVDGVASHAYPNPAFSMPPTVQTKESIASFQFEKNLIQTFSIRNLPIFITETGWSKEAVREPQIADYFKTAFTGIWNDENIVAVTPFLLTANDGPFTVFSLLENNNPSQIYNALVALPKVKGQPALEPLVLAASVENPPAPTRVFHEDTKAQKETDFVTSKPFKAVLKWILQL